MIKQWLFLLFLFIVSDTWASMATARYLLANRGKQVGLPREFVTRIALALLGIFVWNVCNLIGSFQPPRGHTLWFALWYWGGRLCMSAGLWYLWHFISGNMAIEDRRGDAQD